MSRHGYLVETVGWDRDCFLDQTAFVNDQYHIFRIRIRSAHGNGIRNLIPLIKFQFKLMRRILAQAKQTQIIHACNLDTGLTGFLLAKLLRKKFVYDIFDFYADSFPVPKFLKPLVSSLERFLVSNADGLITASDLVQRQFAPAQPKKFECIHNTPMTLDHLEPFGLDKSKLNVVYVGTLSEARFVEEILAVAKLRPQYEFHIAGFGEFESNVKAAQGVLGNVHFYGRVSYIEGLRLGKDATVLYAMYDTKIANYKFNYPNKFYESLMLGTPLIAAKGSGVEYLLTKHSIGFLTDYTVNGFVNVLDDLSTANRDWLQIETELKSIYSKYYSWELMESKLLSLYSAL